MNNLERLTAAVTAEVQRWETDPILPTLMLVGAAGPELLSALERAAQPVASGTIDRGRSGLHVPVEDQEFLVSVTTDSVRIQQMEGVYEGGRWIPIATAARTVSMTWNIEQQVDRVLETYPEDYPEDDDDAVDDHGEDPDTVWERDWESM